jgi:nitroimidazol reductase NimA-like FMN-containing flavoprotein (pyridoxamine 5'-phosphate oxidase superfamily)
LARRSAPGILQSMYSDGSALKQLTRDECLRLMASVPVGRIIYTRQALPAVELVNFVLDDGDIIIKTDYSGKLAAATRGAVVAFEADSVDPARHAGWSVTVIGQLQEVTDPDEIGRLEQIGLSSWAPGGREHFIRISPGILNGRRLSTQRS